MFKELNARGKHLRSHVQAAKTGNLEVPVQEIRQVERSGAAVPDRDLEASGSDARGFRRRCPVPPVFIDP